MSFSAIRIALNLSSRRRPRPRRLPQSNDCKFRFAQLIAAGLLFLASSATPARSEILIEPRVGFHGVFQLGQPFPLEVGLSNTGRPVEGILEVQVWKGGATKGGAPYLANYRREIFLAGQSRKSVQFTVDPDFISRPLSIKFHAAGAKAQREIDLRRHFSPGPVLLLMSGSSAFSPIALTALPQSRRLVTVSPGELAADSRALLGVSHLILYDQSLRELSRAQLLALDHWLTAGGRMVIIGSLNYALYQEPALARFLPVRVSGAKQVSFVPAPDKNQPATALPGVWTQASTVLSGKALAEIDGVPMLVETSRGRGRITYLALDIGRPPLSKWEGLPKFLQPLLAPARAEEPLPRTDWSDAVFNQLIASPKFIATYVPSASLFLAMTGYLLGIGALAWLWQKKRLAPRRLLVALVTFVTGGTVAGYVHFSHGGNIPDGVLLVSTVLENSGEGFVDTQANLALFSTQLRQYDLQLERGWIDLTPVTSRARDTSESAVITQDAGGASRYRLPLREWDYRLYRLRRVDRFGVGAEFEAYGDRLVMRVNNRSGKDLVNCWLLVPGQRFDIGVVPRGASLRQVFPLSNGQVNDATGAARAGTLNLREMTFADKTRDILFHSSMFPRDGDARWISGAAVFFGWVKDPEPRVRIDDPRIQAQDYTLFRAIFPLPGEEEE
jgi:hypothetical protein